LTVPLDYDEPDSPSLELSVIVFEGEGDAEPAIYLEGGPGGAGSLSLERMFPYFEPLLADRDLVALDQRGTGYSSPLLHCTRLESAFDSELSDAEQLDASTSELARCAADFRDRGFEPKQFSTRASAADVERLRQALGYESWHVFGVSYGTRLALDVMRYFPEGVASVVLDSTLPPDVDFLANVPRSVSATFARIFEHCAAQSACNGAYPDLAETFSSMIASLTATPVEIELPNDTTYLLDGRRAIELFGALSYSSENIVYIPELIRQLASGRLDTIRDVVQLLNGEVADVPAVANGLYLSIVCSEYAAFSSVAEVQAAIDEQLPSLRAGFSANETIDLCHAWNVSPATEDERQPIVSDLPALVLAGGYDPVTPPAWGERVAMGLSNGIFEQMESSGHAVFASSCGIRMIREFWDDPSRYSGGACSTLEQDLRFEVPSLSGAGTASLQFAGLPLVRRKPFLPRFYRRR
jgi:pimeloyl-ACP methyl ester carboxylesterase